MDQKQQVVDFQNYVQDGVNPSVQLILQDDCKNRMPGDEKFPLTMQLTRLEEMIQACLGPATFQENFKLSEEEAKFFKHFYKKAEVLAKDANRCLRFKGELYKDKNYNSFIQHHHIINLINFLKRAFPKHWPAIILAYHQSVTCIQRNFILDSLNIPELALNQANLEKILNIRGAAILVCKGKKPY